MTNISIGSVFGVQVSSIPQAHFEAAKQAIRDTCAGLRSQDKLALITFGNEVTVLSSGSEPVADVLAKLDTLHPTDDHTKFYNAMDTLVEADTDKFQSFIRLSGGELYPFGPSNAKTVLDQLVKRLGNVWMLQLLSSQAVETPASVPLVIDLGGLAQLRAELEPDYWIPDQSPPYVTGAEADPASLTVTVGFSEPVSGADVLDSYRLTDGENRTVEITAAAYVGADRRTVRLTVPNLERAGTCVLNVAGPVDLSANENKLIPYQKTIGSSAAENPADSAPADGSVQNEKASVAREMRTLLLAAAAAVAAVVLLVVLIVSTAHRRQQPGTDSPAASPAAGPDRSKPEKQQKKRGRKPEKTETRFFFTDKK